MFFFSVSLVAQLNCLKFVLKILNLRYEVVIMDIGFPHYYHPEFQLSLLLSITGDSAET